MDPKGVPTGPNKMLHQTSHAKYASSRFQRSIPREPAGYPTGND